MYTIINSSSFSAVSEKRLNGMMRYGGVFGFAEWLEIHCLGFRSGFFWVGKSVMWKGKSIERYVWNFRGAFDGMKQHERQGPIHWEGKKKVYLKMDYPHSSAIFWEKGGFKLRTTGFVWNLCTLESIGNTYYYPHYFKAMDIPWYTPILDTSNWIWLLRTDMTSARLRHIMLKFQDVFFWDRREVNHDNRKWEREGSYGSPKKMKKQ